MRCTCVSVACMALLASFRPALAANGDLVAWWTFDDVDTGHVVDRIDGNYRLLRP
jgi:hypothetical protein